MKDSIEVPRFTLEGALFHLEKIEIDYNDPRKANDLNALIVAIKELLNK